MHVASLSVAPYAGEKPTVCRLCRAGGMFTRHARGRALGKRSLRRRGPVPTWPGGGPDHVSRHRLRTTLGVGPGGAQQVVGGGASSFAYDAGHGERGHEDDVWILCGYTNASCTCKRNETTRFPPQVNLGG